MEMSLRVRDEKAMKRRGEEKEHVAQKVNKKTKQNVWCGEDEENERDVGVLECIICKGPTSSNGEHQVASLKCGHVFGFSCVSKWLRQQRGNASCPTCCSKASPKDVRKVFLPRHALPVDAGRESELARELKQEREERIRLELENAKLRMLRNKSPMKDATNNIKPPRTVVIREVCPKSLQKISSLEEEIAKYRQELERYKGMVQPKSDFLPLQHARVLSIVDSTSAAVSSGATIAQMCLETWRTVRLHSDVHSAAIRDLKTVEGRMLSASLDRSVVHSSGHGCSLRFACESPVWSCDMVAGTNMVCCGLANGTISVFDLRKSCNSGKAVPLSRIKLGRGPVHSLHGFCHQALLVGSLKGLHFINFSQKEFGNVTHTFQFGENIADVCYNLRGDLASNLVVASHRSSSSNPAKHTVYRLSSLVTHKPGAPSISPFCELVGHENKRVFSRVAISRVGSSCFVYGPGSGDTGDSLLRWEVNSAVEPTLPFSRIHPSETIQLPEPHAASVYDLAFHLAQSNGSLCVVRDNGILRHPI